jgi:hypothetical protein
MEGIIGSQPTNVNIPSLSPVFGGEGKGEVFGLYITSRILYKLGQRF